MSFCFNFQLEVEEDCDDGTPRPQSQPHRQAETLPESPDGPNHNNPGGYRRNEVGVDPSEPAFEVNSFYNDTVISKLKSKTVIFNKHSLKMVDTNDLENLMSVDEEFKSTVCKSTSLGDIVTHSDLVNGVYEGGLKVWECGVDLTNYLSSIPQDSFIQIVGKRVLELGCGAGLPGLYCVQCGASCVHFQDYNVEVIKLLTHTNVQYNTIQQDGKAVCRYFVGDWESFCDLDVNCAKYDLILTAETIYNVENYPKLHKVFDEMLAADGIILIAAKIYYFGVGGSVDAFMEFVAQRNCFACETVWETKSGVPRSILMLKRIQRRS